MLFPDWSNNLDCDGKFECGAPVPQITLREHGHQIDHFVCRKGDLCRVSNCGVVAQLMDSDHRALQTTLRVRHSMVRKVDARQQLLRHELGHLVGQGEKVDEAKGEFCEVVHRIMRENGSEGQFMIGLWLGWQGQWRSSQRRASLPPLGMWRLVRNCPH